MLNRGTAVTELVATGAFCRIHRSVGGIDEALDNPRICRFVDS
jgi:hypothetical protein